MLLIYFAPIFILFELVQLTVAERFIGIRQIRQGKSPLDSTAPGRNALAAAWLACIFIYWAYMVLLAWDPRAGLQGILMILASVAGLMLRRVLGIRFALVVLTLEGAVRIGLLANLLLAAFVFQHRWWTG